MPRLLTPGRGLPVLATSPRARGWRLAGLNLAVDDPAATVYALVAFGDGGGAQDSPAEVPRRLVLERSLVHGTPTGGIQRCVALNSAATTIRDSRLTDCHDRGYDTQAIGGWNGPGPFRIENNLLEGAGENVMFGGADPAIRGLVPSNIVIRRNLIRKPLAWRGRLDGQEPARAEERSAGADRGQRVREQLGRRPEWRGDPLHRAQSGRQRTVVDRSRRALHGQRRAPRRARHQPARPRRRASQRPHPGRADRGQRLQGGRLSRLWGRRLDGQHRCGRPAREAQYGVQRGHPGGRVRRPAPRLSDAAEHRPSRPVRHQGRRRASGLDTLRAYFPGAVVRDNVLAGAEREAYPRRNRFPRTLRGLRRWQRLGFGAPR